MRWYIGVGPGDLVYYTDANWAQAIHVLNFATGAELGAFDLNGDGIGDLVRDPVDTPIFLPSGHGRNTVREQDRVRLQQNQERRESQEAP